MIAGVLCALTLLAAGCGGAKDEKKSANGGEWKPKGANLYSHSCRCRGRYGSFCRVFAKFAKEKTGYDFVVVNAKGAAGSVASNQVRAAKPDGTTVLYGHELVNVANVAGVTDFNYSAFKLGPSFAMEPAQQFYVLNGKYKDLKDFIAQAKANPGKLKAAQKLVLILTTNCLPSKKLLILSLILLMQDLMPIKSRHAFRPD